MDVGQITEAESSAEERQRSSGGRTTRHVLPPCKVCGAQAKGFHYGVNTCEACKGFFRRSVIRRLDYVCLDDPERCVVKPGMRKNCASCRYKRCLQVGMSLDAIRIGRYTTEKKNRDILEVKAFEVRAKKPLSAPHERDQVKEDLFKQVMAAQEKNCVEISNLIRTAKGDQEEYLLKQENERKIFGVRKPVCFEYFNSIYQSTGIEIDDRLKVLDVLLPFLESGLRNHVNFSKDLPGFKALPMADQIAIIKNTVVETWVISRYFCINTEHGLLTANDESGQCITFDVMQIFDDWGVLLLKTAKRIEQLQLTNEELIILKVLDMYVSDRCNLDARKQVQAMQDAVLDLFQDLLKKNHPTDHGQILARTISILTELRTLSHFSTKKCEETSLSLVPDNLFPPLLKEILIPPKQAPVDDYPAQINCLLGCEKGCCVEEVASGSRAPTFFSHMAEPLRRKMTSSQETPSPSDGYQSDETGPQVTTPIDSTDEGFVSSFDATLDEESTQETRTLTDISNNVPRDGCRVPQLDEHRD
ncbi:hypothetical protein CAPTEDRAFT_227950 [Capitella teleta]|uniref:Nuclear receptor domain-containing protein n=1 Tax=Capitella teleta TaxID=283909 RepID=R7TRG6_CAPTE|nr:hypothetical protein CAPTEDRAFT_227950 [Capitella teleta]|eukprot:ELT94091.1 hypothetical protein CAPTEDRAFT_227950 [Capitella teleta]